MGKALLVILDGYGIAADPSVSAIDQARKPFIDSLLAEHPSSRLIAGGEAVGLPEGQFGNSEVGHLNIGSGRIVWQELSRINKDIREGAFYTHPVLLDAVAKAKAQGRIHLMGLFSDGGVHSQNEHLYALLDLCTRNGLDNVYVHAFADGRDTAPDGGQRYCEEFEARAAHIGVGRLVSVIGRYYAMDRDNRWERVEKAYRLMVDGVGSVVTHAKDAFTNSYADGVTDEFIHPTIVGSDGAETRIRENDVVLFFNFRGDRAREISVALNRTDFTGFETRPLHLSYYCFTQYDATFAFAKVVFEPTSLKNTLGEWVAAHGKSQLRIAETEKYPHVSFFFNGGVETPYPGEDRILVPSPKVATYDLQPEMSAFDVTDKLIAAIETTPYDLVILNYANPDMVGHTGSLPAAAKAVEAIDVCMSRLIPVARKQGYEIVVIADHGNSDCMINPDGSPHTAHTLAPVPVLVIRQGAKTPPKPGILADVAPTLLALMGLEKPEEMTGTSLVDG
jgi:2,3-bisphosphoglycerate-independent phosphoglycerate mutase